VCPSRASQTQLGDTADNTSPAASYVAQADRQAGRQAGRQAEPASPSGLGKQTNRFSVVCADARGPAGTAHGARRRDGGEGRANCELWPLAVLWWVVAECALVPFFSCCVGFEVNERPGGERARRPPSKHKANGVSHVRSRPCHLSPARCHTRLALTCPALPLPIHHRPHGPDRLTDRLTDRLRLEHMYITHTPQTSSNFPRRTMPPNKIAPPPPPPLRSLAFPSVFSLAPDPGDDDGRGRRTKRTRRAKPGISILSH
jgi:hypothetical protein